MNWSTTNELIYYNTVQCKLTGKLTKLYNLSNELSIISLNIAVLYKN